MVADDADRPGQQIGAACVCASVQAAGQARSPLASPSGTSPVKAESEAGDSDDKCACDLVPRRVHVAPIEGSVAPKGVSWGTFRHTELLLMETVDVVPEPMHTDMSTRGDDAVSQGTSEDGDDGVADVGGASNADAVHAAAAEVCDAMLARGRKARGAPPRVTEADRSGGAAADGPHSAQPELSVAGSDAAPRVSESWGVGSVLGADVATAEVAMVEAEAPAEGRSRRPLRQCCTGSCVEWDEEDDDDWEFGPPGPPRSLDLGVRSAPVAAKKKSGSGAAPCPLILLSHWACSMMKSSAYT